MTHLKGNSVQRTIDHLLHVNGIFGVCGISLGYKRLQQLSDEVGHDVKPGDKFYDQPIFLNAIPTTVEILLPETPSIKWRYESRVGFDVSRWDNGFYDYTS